jgi:hypothetical protein
MQRAIEPAKALEAHAVVHLVLAVLVAEAIKRRQEHMISAAIRQGVAASIAAATAPVYPRQLGDVAAELGLTMLFNEQVNRGLATEEP